MVKVVSKMTRSPLSLMSEATGIGYHSLRRIFNGKTQFILLPVAEKLAKYAKVSVAKLPEWIEDQKLILGYMPAQKPDAQNLPKNDEETSGQ